MNRGIYAAWVLTLLVAPVGLTGCQQSRSDEPQEHSTQQQATAPEEVDVVNEEAAEVQPLLDACYAQAGNEHLTPGECLERANSASLADQSADTQTAEPPISVTQLNNQFQDDPDRAARRYSGPITVGAVIDANWSNEAKPVLYLQASSVHADRIEADLAVVSPAIARANPGAYVQLTCNRIVPDSPAIKLAGCQ
jgi:hypothetical protein